MLTIYTDRLPENAAGRVLFGIAFIRPAYRDDIGLHEHERVHVHQTLRGLILVHGWRYRFSKAYRLRCEVEAYKEQLKHPPANSDVVRYRDMYAGFIANHYGLDLSVDRARELLETP